MSWHGQLHLASVELVLAGSPDLAQHGFAKGQRLLCALIDEEKGNKANNKANNINRS